MHTDQRRNIEADCRRLLDRYAVAVNVRDFAAFAEAFTSDGVWNRPGSPLMQGRDAIRSFMEGLPRDRRVAHINGTVRIDVIDADNATGISYTTVYLGMETAGTASMQGPHHIVQYEDRFRRIAEGWFIARRDTTIVFSAVYGNGLPGVANPARKA